MRWLIALLVLACCAGPPQQIGAQPSWRKPTAAATPVRPVTFAPGSEPATRYNESLQAPPHTALGDAVIAAVTDAANQAHVPVPAADVRLFRACTELAQIASEDGVVDYSLIEFALQRNGIIEPSPHLLVLWANTDSPARIVDQLTPQLAEILGDGATARVGIGAVQRKPDGTSAVVFALQGSAVTTSPVPRALPAGGSFKLDAIVDIRYHEPEVFVTRDDGTTERLALEQGHSGAFKSTIMCGKHIGRQQIEITASGVSGSTVLANFPVYCGTEPPLALTVEPSHDDGGVIEPAGASQRLFALLNRDRKTAGLPALVWDDRVAKVAQGYSEEMRRTKLVAHVSPTSGSAADRVRVAGIKTAVVLENVARAYGVGEAHAGLMNSPGHRANLMSPTATHVGIGVALGDDVGGKRELFVTQVFIRIPPKVDAARAAQIVEQQLDTVRAVKRNPKLTATAQQLADGLAAGKSRDSLWPAASRQLDALGNQYARVGSVITAVSELDSLDGKQLVGDYKPDDVGIGIAQGTHPEIGEGAIWIVILMAEKLGTEHRDAPPQQRR
ncbi:MAG: CAP domain-containing protein [Deltaproteobacteria bacterium]